MFVTKDFVNTIILIHAKYILIFVIVDLLTTMLVRATGQIFFIACPQNMQLSELAKADCKLWDIF